MPPRVLLLGLWFLLAAGTCNTKEEVSTGDQIAGSPSPEDATVDNPVIVDRDNPSLSSWTTLHAGESSSASVQFFSGTGWRAKTRPR